MNRILLFRHEPDLYRDKSKYSNEHLLLYLQAMNATRMRLQRIHYILWFMKMFCECVRKYDIISLHNSDFVKQFIINGMPIGLGIWYGNIFN
jgi:hypothetical protein